MKILSILATILEKIIGIVNIFLIIIIVLNIINFIFHQVEKESFISFLDYTYISINEQDNYLKLNNGDFVLIDLKRTPMNNEVAFYQEKNKTYLGKILDIKEKTIIIKNSNVEKEILTEEVLGTVIKVIPNLGNIINLILKLSTLLISLIIIIITSIVQILLNKLKIKLKKPDFKQFNNPV